MGAWNVRALDSDDGLDVIGILTKEYVSKHPIMDMSEIIELMKEEGILGNDFSEIDFIYDITAMALSELYFQWKNERKLDYDTEECVWDSVTYFTASKESIDFLLQQLTDIKNEVLDEDGIREIVDLWKDEESEKVNQAWMEHLEWLIRSFVSEQEV